MKVTKQFEAVGLKLSVLHGSMNTDDQNKNLTNFEEGRTNIIATTDMLSRGVNFGITAVINYDLARSAGGGPCVKSYFYRSSRCGRFGQKGVCISFGNVNEIKKIENAAKIKIEKIRI